MRHIPNILSVFRILLIPLFVWQMMADRPLVAAVVLLVSGLTDFFDGSLARRFGWISNLGKVLDPAADKLTQVAVCIVMAIKLHGYWPIFLVLIAKEVVMMVLGGYLLRKGVKIEGAKWFGKVVTFLFYAVMILILFFPTMASWLRTGLLVLTTLCALAAMLMYVPEFLRYRREGRNRTK